MILPPTTVGFSANLSHHGGVPAHFHNYGRESLQLKLPYRFNEKSIMVSDHLASYSISLLYQTSKFQFQQSSTSRDCFLSPCFLKENGDFVLLCGGYIVKNLLQGHHKSHSEAPSTTHASTLTTPTTSYDLLILLLAMMSEAFQELDTETLH